MFFITGISGAGKSEVTLNLRQRGYEAYDTDDDALARWQNVETGYIHPKSSVKSEQRTEDFLKQHKWNVPREFVEEIARKADDKTIFICGVANNLSELSDLFDVVFALTIDEKTLISRLASRTNNDWGKQPHELQQTLEIQKQATDNYKQLGHVIIDATRPVKLVVDDILAKTKEV